MPDIFDTRFDGQDVELDDNRVHLGDDINIIQKDPTLRHLHVGFGWDLHSFNADAMDLDFSLFLIGKNGMTREDGDFIFYNNKEACGGGIKYGGDSRTGAGEGDDESFLIDLQSIPFDVMQLVLTVTLYKGHEKDQNMGMVHNAFIRIANADTQIELMRYELDKQLEDRRETGMIAGFINREGPKWHFVPQADFYPNGLAELATKYGLIITQQ